VPIRYDGKMTYGLSSRVFQVSNLNIHYSEKTKVYDPQISTRSFHCNHLLYCEGVWRLKFRTSNLKSMRLCVSCFNDFLALPGNEELLAFIMAYELQKNKRGGWMSLDKKYLKSLLAGGNESNFK